jgi:hypothetical protein
METLQYTHKSLKLKDIRYRGSNDKGYYILAFDSVPPVNIDKSIFENVLFKVYGPLFMKDMTYDRIKEMLWNVHISEGHFFQWDKEYGDYVRVDGKPNRTYISRIDKAGVLSELTYIG